MPDQKPLLSQISVVRNGVTTTYEIKDAVAREWISKNGLVFHIATDAATTPFGVQWINDQSQLITGTLAAWNATESRPQTGIYLVRDNVTNEAQDVYAEYVTVVSGSTPSELNTSWERLGDTTINWSELQRHISATVNPHTTSVLGANTTFTNAQSATSIQYGDSSDFVKSYPGTTSKLETSEITGCGDNITFNAVGSNTDYTATNTVFGTDTEASKIVTETKEATKTVFGTDAVASKATAGTNITNLAYKGSSKNISYINASSVLESATYDSATETLTIGSVAISNDSVVGVDGTNTATITPYTFTDVTVPQVTSNDDVSVASVKTNTAVVVPVISSNTPVTTTKITVASKTAATKAGSATTVATGSLKSDDTHGATIMTGLGTATTGTAVTTLGSGSKTAAGTAAAQTITVGTAQGAVDVLDSNTTVSINVSANPNNVTPVNVPVHAEDYSNNGGNSGN